MPLVPCLMSREEVEHIIDAKGKRIGRIASEAAMLLQGKRSPSYRRHAAPDIRVVVINTQDMSVPIRKALSKVYHTHSGYRGNLKETTLGHMMKKNPNKALLYAISGMLPKNTLRKTYIKHLRLMTGSPEKHT